MQYQRVHIIIACTGKVGDHTTLFWRVRNFRTILYLTLSFLGMRLLNCCVCVSLLLCRMQTWCQGRLWKRVLSLPHSWYGCHFWSSSHPSGFALRFSSCWSVSFLSSSVACSSMFSSLPSFVRVPIAQCLVSPMSFPWRLVWDFPCCWLPSSILECFRCLSHSWAGLDPWSCPTLLLECIRVSVSSLPRPTWYV